MGSVQGFNDVCKRCGYPTESYDYYYRTGEGWRYCAACGSYHSGFMQKDNSSYIRNRKICPLDGSYVIGIKDLNTNEMLWTHPITNEMDHEKLERFLQMDENLYKQFDIQLSAKNYINVFHLENGKYEQVLFVGDTIHLEMVNGITEKLILEQVAWDITHEDGYGVINIVYMNPEKKTVVIDFDKPTSEEDALKQWKSYETEPVDLEQSFLTIWDDKLKELLILKGTPISYAF